MGTLKCGTSRRFTSGRMLTLPRDRRSLASNVPSGVLCGHTEGITFCAPKGDGRYVTWYPINRRLMPAQVCDQ